MRPEPVVFFLDRSVGKHHVSAALRALGAVVELHDEHFGETTEDAAWIAAVARSGWVILTKDQRIRRRPLERAAVVASGARMFALTSGNLSGPAMAEVFGRHLHKMMRIALGEPAPFIALVSRSGIRIDRVRR